MSEPDHWDPEPSERKFYRSSVDGQRGYLVRREGKDIIRLDRPMEEILKPFNESWRADMQVYPVSEHQVARIAFIADRALCGVLGRHDLERDDWLSLHEKARIKWMKEGPNSGDVRDDLYDAIIGTLRPMSNG